MSKHSMAVMEKKLKTVPLDTMIDRHIGKLGTPDRDAFDNRLRIDLNGEAIHESHEAGHPSDRWLVDEGMREPVLGQQPKR